VLAGLALLPSACGSNAKQDAKTPPPPKGAAAATPAPTRDPPSKADVAVIKGWTNALRKGHVKEAARYFALPALVQNGSPVYRLRKRSEVELWNRGLPCGARFKEAVDTGAYVVATLVLTERPGAGRCGKGVVGNEAYTAFLIRRHKIVQWRRVVEAPAEPAPEGPES
jgi:limonene-1,2-epoxide hydrolase